MTNHKCEAEGIKASDKNYNKKCAGTGDVAWEKFLAATFFFKVDRHQYGGIMTHLCNDYTKVQQTYLEIVHKVQTLLTAWEGGKYPFHGSKEVLSFSNAVNNDDCDKDADEDGDTQAIGGRASRGGVTETRHCYYCKKVGHMKLGFLKLKAERAAKESENSTSGGATKIDKVKDGVDKHAHMMLEDSFRDFNTRAQYKLFFYQVT